MMNSRQKIKIVKSWVRCLYGKNSRNSKDIDYLRCLARDKQFTRNLKNIVKAMRIEREGKSLEILNSTMVG